MGHPNLSDQINSNIAQSEIEGGVFVATLRIGAALDITTRNRTYRLNKVADGQYSISGHPKYCPTDTQCFIHGSTWGGSMHKTGFIGRGMHLEFSTPTHRAPITTSMIQEITELQALKEAA